MKNLPGTRSWHADFVGYVTVSDWEFGDNGGVVLWDDGAIWSYAREAPAGADQYANYPAGPVIYERALGSPAWERLMPDSWGQPSVGDPFGYPNWPSFTNDPLDTSDFTGPMAVAHVALHGSLFHLRDDDRLWLYDRSGNNVFGPISFDRSSRTWTRYISTTAAGSFYQDISSNIVLDGQYMYYLRQNPATSPRAIQLVRMDKDNPNDYVVLHQWLNSVTYTGQNTLSLDMPGFINQPQQLRANSYSIAIDDGYLYMMNQSRGGLDFRVWDSRTTSPNTAGTGVNYTMKYSGLWRVKIGEPYDVELLYWHDTQGFIGRDAVGSSTGSYNFGTLGVTNLDAPAFDGSSGADPNGMGFAPDGYRPMYIVDGWLYWFDYSGVSNNSILIEKGNPTMLCRMKLADLDPTSPVKHDTANPLFEIIVNGNGPYRGASQHAVDYGPYIAFRCGSDPLVPTPDAEITFDGDGNIWYQGVTFPEYIGDISGWATRAIIKLAEPRLSTTNVTLNFDGDELKGYAPVRDLPKRSGNLEVELR